MGLFDKLKQVFSGGQQGARFLNYQVRCNRCGEVLDLRIDTYNDLSPEYDEKGKPVSFYCRKLVSGDGSNRCFQVVEVILQFDKARRLAEHDISGGSWVADAP